MGTHCLIFLTIGNLVSPPSFPFARQMKGRTGPPFAERKICPVSAVRESRAVKPRGLLSRSCRLRDKMFTHTQKIGVSSERNWFAETCDVFFNGREAK